MLREYYLCGNTDYIRNTSQDLWRIREGFTKRSQRNVRSGLHKLEYLLFIIPIALAYFSWQYFPAFVNWFITTIFRYNPINEQASIIWYWTIRFFYTWYTTLAIAIAGTWAILAYLARHKHVEQKQAFYPVVTLIVPAYNEEKNVARCINSIYTCADRYRGNCEIIVIDDGSTDNTYEIAWTTINQNKQQHPHIRGKVIRNMTNLGKIEAVKTAVNTALGGLIAIVDADSWWTSETLVHMVDYMIMNGKKAVTGYVNPSDGNGERNTLVILQQLEYSQGLAIIRNAETLGNNVLVVSGAVGLYDAETLRAILNDTRVQSVTEDLEITLEMHKRGAGIGYVNTAYGSSIAPQKLSALWNQRLRWFKGWLHNTLSIHRETTTKRSWLTSIVIYAYIFEYFGAFIDLASLIAFPFLFAFAPDIGFFALSLILFVPYSLLLGIANQAIALKFAYDNRNHHKLLYYTPLYPILRIVNIFARIASIIKYGFGDRGDWHR